MCLEQRFAYALSQVVNTLVDAVEIEGAEKTPGANVAHVTPGAADEFICHPWVDVVVLSRAKPKVLEFPNVVISKQLVIEFGDSVVAIEHDVEAWLFSLIRGCPGRVCFCA